MGGGSAEALTRSWWYPGVYTSETFARVGEGEGRLDDRGAFHERAGGKGPAAGHQVKGKVE
ncbi:MAG: hypothetical protein VCG02_02600 [Verrucomicrobiota bacterium]